MDLRVQYLRKELRDFVLGPRCCAELSASFLALERCHLSEETQKFGIQVIAIARSGGASVIKVVKPFCSHVLAAPLAKPKLGQDFRLHQPESLGGVGILLASNLLGSAIVRPTVPPHRFAISPVEQSPASRQPFNNVGFQRTPPQVAFLQALAGNRVLVVNGTAGCGMSTLLPLCLMDELVRRHAHCKIVCVEREQLLALHHSGQLAQRLGERIGSTVAYQVPLQSRISEISNLIYTTANFLLRVLMGQHAAESWQHLTHVFIADVHLHEPFAGLLLSELRIALRMQTQLRVVLLSDACSNAELLAYFGEGAEIQMPGDSGTVPPPVRVLYVKELRQLLSEQSAATTGHTPAYAHPPPASEAAADVIHLQRVYLDRCLEQYAQTGSQQAFEAFLYLVVGEYADINYRHGVSGNTAAIIAAQYGNVAHLRQLLSLHADPFVMNELSTNAIFSACALDNGDCLALLSDYCSRLYRASPDADSTHIDLPLIVSLVQLLLTQSQHWTAGNILVLLPSYDQLTRLNYALLHRKLTGQLPGRLAIHLLHAHMEPLELDTLFAAAPYAFHVLLATDLVESLDVNQLPPIHYLIDTARLQRLVFNAAANCQEERYVWAAQETMRRRYGLLRHGGIPGATCFRLLPVELMDELPLWQTPELLAMPLDRICLTAKLLSPLSSVTEYLQQCIVTPPLTHIAATIELLKRLQIFDQLEDLTWLGCRLIDVPIDCQLGKLLVHAILLQCLDPILTIVSFLAYRRQPLDLPNNEHGSLSGLAATLLREKLKAEIREHTGAVPSDHLLFVRLYQAWQNELRDDGATDALLDEQHFVRHRLMERVCDIRTQLVGALRSAQLIHSQGQLSMHNVNGKAHSWPLIKATLVGGLYPNICLLDRQNGRIHSGQQRELMLHPSSVLRGLRLLPANVYAAQLRSPWLVYSQLSDSVCCNSIRCCSVIEPIAVALFGGALNANCSNVQIDGLHAGETQVTICLDDCLTFSMRAMDAQLVLHFRQCFYERYMSLVEHCVSPEYTRRNFALNFSFNSNVERLLQQQDANARFQAPENIGLRPKAVPTRTLKYNAVMAFDRGPSGSTSHSGMERQFFLVYRADSSLPGTVLDRVRPHLSNNQWQLTYLILHHNDRLHTVTLVEHDATGRGAVRLHECFKNRIPIYELLALCSECKFIMPVLNEHSVAIKLDRQIGDLILELFAYRNNLLHNN